MDEDGGPEWIRCWRFLTDFGAKLFGAVKMHFLHRSIALPLFGVHDPKRTFSFEAFQHTSPLGCSRCAPGGRVRPRLACSRRINAWRRWWRLSNSDGGSRRAAGAASWEQRWSGGWWRLLGVSEMEEQQWWRLTMYDAPQHACTFWKQLSFWGTYYDLLYIGFPGRACS